MIEVDIPGWGKLTIKQVVFDYNGTLAVDGSLLPGVAGRLEQLASHAALYVVTADTFGKTRASLSGLPCDITILPPGAQDIAKQDFVRRLGAAETAAFGNGRNDRLMLQEAALGVAILQGEGAAAVTLTAADVVVPDICSGLDLLLHPLRLVATLRS